MSVKTWTIWATALGWGLFLAVAPAPAAPEDEKLVEEMYGARIKVAQGTADEADDLALAQEMLTAAADTKNPRKLCAVLARRALDVSMTLSSEMAAGEARKALDLADGFEPYGGAERARLGSEISVRQLQNAKKAQRSAEELRGLAAQAVNAMLEYAAALMESRGKESDAGAALQRARTLMTGYGVSNAKDAVDETAERYKQYCARERLLKPALGRLKDAQDHNSSVAAAKAGAEVADIFLRLDGDLQSAAEYLKDADDAQAKAVKAGAAFLTSRQLPDTADCLPAVETLAGLSEKHKGAPGEKIAECAAGLCEAYLQAGAKGTEAAKARLLLTRLSHKAEVAPKLDEASVRKAIQDAYGPLHAKLTILPDGRTRMTYDFSDLDQFQDWTPHEGVWEVGAGVLACKTSAYRSGTASNKFRFSSKKPFKVSFRGTAKYELSLALYGDDSSSGHYDTYYYNYIERFALGPEGLYNGGYYYPYGATTSVTWRNSNARIQPGASYQFEIEYDGVKQFTWRINGVEVRKFEIGRRIPSSRNLGFFKVHLGTGSSDYTPTGFDDVVIEGEIVTDKAASGGASDRRGGRGAKAAKD